MSVLDFFRKNKVRKSAEPEPVPEAMQPYILDLGKLLGFDPTQYDEGRLSEVTYFACLKMLSEAVAKLPLTLQRVSADGGVEEVVNDPLYTAVKLRPNPFMTPSAFWEAMENSRNHYGNAYSQIRYTERSVELYPLASDRMRVCVPDNMRLPYVRDICYEYSAPETGELIRFRSDEILHFKSSMTFSGLFGISVRDKLRLSLDGAKESQKVLNELYKNNMAGRAVVQFSPTQEMKEGYQERYVKQLDDFAHGRKKTGSTFIPIPYGTSVTPLNLRLADEQFLELRKYTALQIASAFGIKPNQLNDYEKASYANSEAQQLAFYVETMLSILKQYEEELNYKLLSSSQIAQGYRFKFNVAAVLRGDTKAQVESLCQGIAGGLYTPNEARRMLDLPSKEGGERIYFNGSNIAVEDAGIQYQALPEVSEENSNEKAFLYLAKTIESAIMSLKGKDNYLQDPTTGQMMGSTPSGGGGGSLGKHSKKPIIEITDKAIDKVPYVAISGYSEEQCKKIQEQHKELLRFARDENGNKETAFVFRKDLSDRSEVKGTDDRLDLGGSMHGKGTDLIIMHNHPRNSSYSTTDIDFFAGNTDIKTLTIVKNNGKIETLTKGNNFDLSVFQKEYNRLYTKIVLTDTDAEKDKFVKTLLTKTRSGVIWNVG